MSYIYRRIQQPILNVLEAGKSILLLGPIRTQIRYWQDQNGPEVDWVVDQHDKLIPIEVKWSEAPSIHDSKHLQIFLKEYQEAKHGYIVCKTPYAFKITDEITAIPWQELEQWVFKE